MYDIFSDFASFFDGFDVYPVYREEVRCKTCGRRYRDFQKAGKLGCGDCYKTFEAPLDITLRRIHGSDEHKGKVPTACCEELRKKKKIEKIKADIAAAVAAEDYEKAAALHKELKSVDA